ncbi:CPBP family intramembrane glutamic endopeptidase [Sinomicrobium sp. M5D2P9]
MYIEQAFKGKHELWRYILGVFVTFGGSQVIGSLVLGAAMAYKAFTGGNVGLSNPMDILTIYDPNIMLVLLLVPFALGLGGLYLWMKPVHGLPFKVLHSARQKLDWKKIFFSFGLWGLISIVFIWVGYFISPEDYQWNFKLVPFVIMCIISILLIPLQTSFEEYIFRGYLMQGIGVFAKNRWVPLVATSLIFGFMHIFNPEIGKIGYVALVAYVGIGFFLGIITLMDEGIELALGFHAANNLFIALFVTADWTAFQTHSVLKDLSEPSVGFEIFFPLIVIYPVLTLIFARKYGWKGWKDKLFGKITPPAPEESIQTEI